MPHRSLKTASERFCIHRNKPWYLVEVAEHANTSYLYIWIHLCNSYMHTYACTITFPHQTFHIYIYIYIYMQLFPPFLVNTPPFPPSIRVDHQHPHSLDLCDGKNQWTSIWSGQVITKMIRRLRQLQTTEAGDESMHATPYGHGMFNDLIGIYDQTDLPF